MLRFVLLFLFSMELFPVLRSQYNQRGDHVDYIVWACNAVLVLLNVTLSSQTILAATEAEEIGPLLIRFFVFLCVLYHTFRLRFYQYYSEMWWYLYHGIDAMVILFEIILISWWMYVIKSRYLFVVLVVAYNAFVIGVRMWYFKKGVVQRIYVGDTDHGCEGDFTVEEVRHRKKFNEQVRSLEKRGQTGLETVPLHDIHHHHYEVEGLSSVERR